MERCVLMHGLPMIHSMEDMASLVQQAGLMPFTRSAVPGFSVGERTAPGLWFADDVDGPWEWKGPVIESTGCAYGKLLGGKTAFVTREWYADLANYRRNGDDFELRFDEGGASANEKRIMDVLAQYPSMDARTLKREAGFAKSSAFDSAIAKLQAQCFVTIVDFDYDYDRFGQRQGWAVTRYATPENYFGEDYIEQMYERDPGESYDRLLAHLIGLLGSEYEKQIVRMLG